VGTDNSRAGRGSARRANHRSPHGERLRRSACRTGNQSHRPQKIIFAGLSLEVCAAFPAITAVGQGLDAYVAVDACGTFSETKHQVGLLRMMQAGVILSDYATLMVEILKDNGRPESGAVYAALDMDWSKLVGHAAKAYGRQLEAGGPGRLSAASSEALRRGL
jgi:Isochorismatase family